MNFPFVIIKWPQERRRRLDAATSLKELAGLKVFAIFARTLKGTGQGSSAKKREVFEAAVFTPRLRHLASARVTAKEQNLALCVP